MDHIVTSYTQQFEVSGLQVESFNSFLREVAAVFTPIHHDEMTLAVSDVRCLRPTMYPSECRLRKMTYAAAVVGDVKMTLKGTSSVVKNVRLFNLPVMLRSDLCLLSKVSLKISREMGEDELGGSFVVDGEDRMVPLEDELAENHVFTVKGPTWCQADVRGASNLSLRIEADTAEQEKGAVEVHVDGTVVPLFVVMRSLGVRSDQRIADMCGGMDLTPSIHAANKSTVRAGPVLCHIEDPLHRAYFLGYMVECLMRVFRGGPASDLGALKNRRLVTCGIRFKRLCADYNRALAGHVADRLKAQLAYARRMGWENQVLTPDKIHGYFHQPDFLYAAVKTPLPSTYLAKLQALRRFPGAPHAGHYGYVDPLEMGLAYGARITHETPNSILAKIPGLIPLGLNPKALIGVSKVLLDGVLVGCTEDAPYVVDHLITLRRQGVLSDTVNASWSRDVHIETGGGRVQRPLLYLEDGLLSADIAGWAWGKEGLVEYVDSCEEEGLLVAQNIAVIQRHTHSEIHGVFSLGVLSNLLAFPDHMPFRESVASIKSLVDAAPDQAESPIMKSRFHNAFGASTGYNVMVAVIAGHGAVLNQAAVARGLFRGLQPGDAVASRTGQRLSVSVVPEQDMPFNPMGHPDMIVGPDVAPSALLEMLCGTFHVHTGTFGECSPFGVGDKVKMYSELLRWYRYHSLGKTYFYNGQTGEMMAGDVFVGPAYYVRLPRAPAVEGYCGMTRQPLDGVLYDEGAVAAMVAHGLTPPHDSFALKVDRDTGLPARESSLRTATVEVPYALKQLMQELLAMNVAMRFVTDTAPPLAPVTFRNFPCVKWAVLNTAPPILAVTQATEISVMVKSVQIKPTKGKRLLSPVYAGDAGSIARTVRFMFDRRRTGAFVCIAQNRVTHFFVLYNTEYSNAFPFKVDCPDLANWYAVSDCEIQRGRLPELQDLHDLIVGTCSRRRVNDAAFIVNPNAPCISETGQEPFPTIYGAGPLPKQFKKPFAPVVARCAQRGFADIPVPFSITPGKHVAWEHRSKIVEWKGSECSPLVDQLVQLSPSISVLRIRFTNQDSMVVRREKDKPVVQKRASEASSVHPKFVLHLAGTPYDFTGACILHVGTDRCTWEQQFMRSGPLTDVSTYTCLTVKPDLSDLGDVVEWCLVHDAECRQIAENAFKFFHEYASLAYDYWAYTINAVSAVEKSVALPAEKVARHVLAKVDDAPVQAVHLVTCRAGEKVTLPKGDVLLIEGEGAQTALFNVGFLLLERMCPEITNFIFHTKPDFHSGGTEHDVVVLEEGIRLSKRAFNDANGFPNQGPWELILQRLKKKYTLYSTGPAPRALNRYEVLLDDMNCKVNGLNSVTFDIKEHHMNPRRIVVQLRATEAPRLQPLLSVPNEVAPSLVEEVTEIPLVAIQEAVPVNVPHENDVGDADQVRQQDGARKTEDEHAQEQYPNPNAADQGNVKVISVHIDKPEPKVINVHLDTPQHKVVDVHIDKMPEHVPEVKLAPAKQVADEVEVVESAQHAVTKSGEVVEIKQVEPRKPDNILDTSDEIQPVGNTKMVNFDLKGAELT